MYVCRAFRRGVGGVSSESRQRSESDICFFAPHHFSDAGELRRGVGSSFKMNGSGT
jgi:hypothetical protein